MSIAWYCRLVGQIALLNALFAPRLVAQHGIEVQAGTFLTRDNGWNFEINLVGRLGLATEWSSQWRGVGHVIGRLSGCPCGSYPSIPRPPESIGNGLGIGYDLQRRMFDRRLTVLLGAEWFQVIGEDQARGGTIVGSAGAGWNWGQRRRWGLELRYGAFGRRMSATRGLLEWTVVRRW